MDLNVDLWKEFILERICNITMGNKLDYYKMSLDNPTVNFVGRSAANNGVAGKVDIVPGVMPYPAGSITVALGGSIGTACVQHEAFYTSQNVSVLELEKKVSRQAKLFLARLIMYECKYKYVPFGRELNVHIRNDFSLWLPAVRDNNNEPVIDEEKKYSDEGYIPDWQFMEDYINSLHNEPIRTNVSGIDVPMLNVSTWEDFYFVNTKLYPVKGTEKHEGIFRIAKGKRLTKEDMEEGTTHFLGAIDSNNGVRDYIGQKPIHKAGCITVNYNGSVGEAFYQDEPFWASDDVNILYPTNWQISVNVGLFIATIIRMNKYRFTYGRKWKLERMADSVMELPVKRDSNGEPVLDPDCTYSAEGYIPDWQFMEDYINSLPYSDKLNG